MKGEPSTIGVDRVITRIAARQHGVVARRQLLARGIGDGAIEGRVRKETLRIVHRGVYAVAGLTLPREGQWLAALLACRWALLSHRDAGELWGILPSRSSALIHVSLPHERRSEGHEGIRIHRVRLEGEITERKGIPVTTPARTIFDLAGLLPRRRLERAMDEAAYLHLLPAGSLMATLERNAGRTGSPAFRAAVASHTPGSTRTRSELEERFLALCRRHRLPQPLVNARVAGLEVDFLWPARALVVETNGFASHSRPTTFERDHERDAQLRDADHAVLRFTFRQVSERPAWVAESVRRELIKRA